MKVLFNISYQLPNNVFFAKKFNLYYTATKVDVYAVEAYIK